MLAVIVKSNLTSSYSKEKVAQLAVLTWLFQGDRSPIGRVDAVTLIGL
jgi:hypothetical protein